MELRMVQALAGFYEYEVSASSQNAWTCSCQLHLAGFCEFWPSTPSLLGFEIPPTGAIDFGQQGNFGQLFNISVLSLCTKNF